MSKSRFLQVLPQYMWHTIPVDFAVAFCITLAILKYLISDQKPEAQIPLRPVYETDRGEFVSTVIDLVAYYAPEIVSKTGFTPNWTLPNTTMPQSPRNS